VFDVHQVRHLRQQARVAAPQVFAEPVGDEHVGLEFTARLDQAKIVARVRPAGHHVHGEPACSSSAMRRGSCGACGAGRAAARSPSLATPAWVRAMATCVAPPENPPVTKCITRTGRGGVGGRNFAGMREFAWLGSYADGAP
jgi:hypothetical protein